MVRMSEPATSSRRRLDDYYARKWAGRQSWWADHYPPHQRVYAHALYERRNAEIVRAVGGPWGAVLDLGCGVGDVTRLLSGRAGLIAAVDASAANARGAARNFITGGIGNARVMVADGELLPFRSGSFDVVVLADVLEHIPGRQAALAEIRRTLREGGRLVCVTPSRFALSAIGALDGVVLRMGDLFRRRTAGSEGAPFEHFLTAREMRTELTAAGFTALRYRRICFYPAPDRPGAMGGAMRRLRRRMTAARFEVMAGRVARLFDMIERAEVLNQKQLWVATAP